MTFTDCLPCISIALNPVIGIAAFVGVNWLKARIEGGVRHTFDTKVETIRADTRTSEERLKSELRTKDAEIAVLRDGVLIGRAGRQTTVDWRRVGQK